MNPRSQRCGLGCFLIVWLLAAGEARAADLSDNGWRLWRDERAVWRDDRLFLPSELHLAQLPVNAPTGGWQQLNDHAGITVKPPSTVEEHFWGWTTRPYTPDEYRSAADDKAFANGNYLGVSWWWRNFDVPAIAPDQ